MEIQTKYDINDLITFKPFTISDSPEKKGEIIQMDIRINKNDKNVEYFVLDGENRGWIVNEEDVLTIIKNKGKRI